MIENVIDTTENCRYCLMCRHVCPVGHVTRKETFTPHGWGLTIASIRRGLLEFNDSTVAAIYSCADCGTCRANCVTDQPLPAAIAAMRAEIAGAGLAPAAVMAVEEKLRAWSNPYSAAVPAPTGEQGEVALFVGDDAHFLESGVLPAVLKLLAAVNVKPVLVGIGRNNGYLASSLGFPGLAAEFARAILSELEASGAQTLLLLTPGDYFAFHQLYEERLGLAWPDAITLQEVIPFLAEQLKIGNLAFNRVADGLPYAYLDPTHSVRVPMRFDAPRELLSAVMVAPPLELFWRRERAHPVGNVALQYTNPHIANHLTYARLGDALEVGARLVVTEDPACLAQLRRHAGRFQLRVQGLYELLAEQLV